MPPKGSFWNTRKLLSPIMAPTLAIRGWRACQNLYLQPFREVRRQIGQDHLARRLSVPLPMLFQKTAERGKGHFPNLPLSLFKSRTPFGVYMFWVDVCCDFSLPLPMFPCQGSRQLALWGDLAEATLSGQKQLCRHEAGQRGPGCREGSPSLGSYSSGGHTFLLTGTSSSRQTPLSKAQTGGPPGVLLIGSIFGFCFASSREYMVCVSSGLGGYTHVTHGIVHH